MKKNPLGFLNNKSFHPSTQKNIKKVWIAEQKDKEAKRKLEERKKILEMERAQMEELARLGRSVDEQQLEFMYKPPLSLSHSSLSSHSDSRNNDTQQDPALSKRPPTEGVEYTKAIDITAKPFGKENRRTKCLRCGQIGHQTGEKACPMYDINPNDGWRKSAEDPMYAHLHRGSLAETDEETERLRAQLHQNPGSFMTSTALEDRLKLRENLSDFLPSQHQLLVSDSDEEDPIEKQYGDISAETEFLKTLTRKQKKRLLRHLERVERGETGNEEENTSTSSSSSSDSDTSSDSDSDSSHHRRRKSKRKHKKHKRSKHRKDGEHKSSHKHKRKRKRSESSSPSSSPRRHSHDTKDKHKSSERREEHRTDHTRYQTSDNFEVLPPPAKRKPTDSP